MQVLSQERLHPAALPWAASPKLTVRKRSPPSLGDGAVIPETRCPTASYITHVREHISCTTALARQGYVSRHKNGSGYTAGLIK